MALTIQLTTLQDRTPSESEIMYESNDLRLRGMHILDLQFSIGVPEHITCLDLTGNKLQQIPSAVFDCMHLRCLILSHNKITEIPRNINMLTALYQLELYTNRLTHISPNIRDCRELGYINLAHNRLKTVPEEISTLPNLTHVYVHDNRLESFAKLREFLERNLHSLCLSGNPLTSDITRAHMNPNNIKVLKFWFRRRWIFMYFGIALRCNACVLMSLVNTMH